MFFKIYKAYVRGAYLTTQKNSPRFAKYFTAAQEGLFWAFLVNPVSYFIARFLFGRFELFVVFSFLFGIAIFFCLKFLDKNDYYPNREDLSDNEIKKEVFIYNLISIFLVLLSSTCLYYAVVY